MIRVDRTCTEIHAVDSGRRRPSVSHLLKVYRDVPAYVLLGDPGAGKTTVFENEREALGKSAIDVISANRLLTYDTNTIPREWQNKTLFIDGLDEVRTGTQDGRRNLREIIKLLRAMCNPRFRLSCRAADWLGERDHGLLSAASRNGSLVILRLDPLTDQGILQIVSTCKEIDDPHAFIHAARERGVGVLLENPLSLKLLAQVVGREDGWPASRLELFERAASLLATEYNAEHMMADRPAPASDLLDASGRLCALLILSGAQRYTLSGSAEARSGHLEISCCEYDRHELLLPALRTNLFAEESDGRGPFHPYMSEFVAAKHLSRLISEGLPASRIMALLSGFDGGVVSNLRGVAAWLAALSESPRRELIERDPIGVILYGDVHAFSPEHKKILLRALGREESRLDSIVWTESALAAVATHGMEPVLRDILTFRNEHQPMLIAVVLLALQHGERLPNLTECLMQVVYGDNRWLYYAGWALEAFVYNCPEQDAALDKLERLLRDLSMGTVKDARDHLMGVALRHLYPSRVPPTKIWDYLTKSTNPDDYGSFWSSHLIDRSEPDDIATLLDELATRCLSLRPALKSRYLEELPLDLLARGIELCGDSIEHERLLDWLRVDPWSGPDLTSYEAIQRIGIWLERHPQIQKAVVAEYVSSNTYVSLHIREILYGSSPPSDFGDWCLRQAQAATEPRSAETYLRLALAHGVRRDVLFHYEHETPPLQEIMKRMLVCPLPEGFYDTARERRSDWQEESTHRRSDFVALVQSHEKDLHANQCNAGLLDELANVYFGGCSDVGGHDPQDRIRDLFDDETRLIDATLAGFRGAPFRGDTPSTHEIIGLLKNDGQYMIARPVLAGIEELDDLQELSDRQVRRALAFHFTTFTERARKRGQRLIEVNPAVAAEVLVQCTMVEMQNGTFDDTLGSKLADGEYVALASLVVLPVLRSFPLRNIQPKTMMMLDGLLNAALRHLARGPFVALIAEKLARTSMSTVQRVHWLAVQVVADPDTCVERLCKFVAQQERRGLQLTVFLLQTKPQLDLLPMPTLVAFIELLGSTVAPWDPADSARPYDKEELVRRLVRALADRPDQDTATELARLCTVPILDKWRHTLIDARDRQLVMLRDLTYRHPNVEQVCRTLNGGTPANSEDLAALLVAKLIELADRLRTESTDGWCQFWNHDSHGRPTKPKPENSCRKLLQLLLKPLLPAINLSGEASYANNTRADLRAVFLGFEVPVEIKTNKHRHLWSAAREQLIGKYSSAPATDGYGVYLVVWFGKAETQVPPEGSIPDDANQLRARLLGALSDAERRKISVVVIDVSRA